MIGRDDAIALALAHALRSGVAEAAPRPTAAALRISDGKPGGVYIYGCPDDPAWFVLMPWYDGKDDLMFRSSRVVVIAKGDGRVLFDGDAGDEG
ncbi:MAG: hypothetical protein ACT4PU_00610 [Planctomycetota bacterium]